MRLDFNILWVEDQQDSVKAYEVKIQRSLRREGFKLQTQFAKTVAEAKVFLSSEIYGDHIDLVLMDFDLGVAPMGDDGLLAVRDVFYYKDIVFYSADVAGLLKKVAEKKIQGIFCSTRDDLPDTVIGVFEALVKKVLDIDHSRGIVMGASSDIDHLINECLSAAVKKGDKDLWKKAVKIIAKRMSEIRKRFEKEANAVESVAQIDDLLNLYNIYTSIDRLNLLRKLLEGADKHKSDCEHLENYAFKTIPKRNILAHVRVQRNGFSRKLVDKDGNELTSGDMKNLREALLGHQEVFETLANLLKA